MVYSVGIEGIWPTSLFSSRRFVSLSGNLFSRCLSVSVLEIDQNEQYKQASDKSTLAAKSAELVTDLTPHKDVGSREDEEKEDGMIFSLII